MKFIRSLFAALVFLPLALDAEQTSPREQFQAAVAAFQKNSTQDSAQKLAELSKQLDPPPAIPEDARFHALKGAAFVKQAGDAAAFAKAAGEFRAAIALAPWVGEYHYNLAVCEKSAGQFSAALAAVKFASFFARDDKERDDCLVLRADLEAAQELAVAKQVEVLAEQKKAAANSPAAKARRDQELIRSLNGAKFVGRTEYGGGTIVADVYEIHGQEIRRYEEVISNPDGHKFWIRENSPALRKPGDNNKPAWVMALNGRVFGRDMVLGSYMEISEDGQSIRFLRLANGEVKDDPVQNVTEPQRVR